MTTEVVIAIGQLLITGLGVIFWYLLTSTRNDVHSLKTDVEKLRTQLLTEYDPSRRVEAAIANVLSEVRRIEAKMDLRMEAMHREMHSGRRNQHDGN